MSKSLKATTNEMLPETQEAITEFYRLTALGVPKMEAYEQSGVSAATISVNKKLNPEQITALSEKGEALALREMLTNIDIRQIRFTRDALAIIEPALLNSITNLARVVNNDYWDDRDGNQITIYPRDLAEASRILRDFYKEGMIAQTVQMARALSQASPGESQDKDQFHPVLGFDGNFTNLEATRPDGTRIRVAVDNPDDVIEIDG